MNVIKKGLGLGIAVILATAILILNPLRADASESSAERASPEPSVLSDKAQDECTMTFIVEGQIYEVVKVACGDTMTAPVPQAPVGYRFAGWERGGDSLPFDFSYPISADASLYARYELAAPSFTISSIIAEYDGEVRKLGFASLEHPLKEKGKFSYEWYRSDGEFCSGAPVLDIRSVKDSGSYFCKLTFSYNGDFVTVTTSEIKVEIKKCVVEAPIIPSKKYTAYPLYADVFGEGVYEADKVYGTEVGEYPVRLRIVDFDNFCWADGSEVIEVPFYIEKAENGFLSLPRIESAYSSGRIVAAGQSRFGEPQFFFSSDGVSYSREAPSEPGEYLFKAVVSESANYLGVESEPQAFSVLPVFCLGLKLDAPPVKREYFAFERVDITGLSVSAIYSDGTVKELSPAALEIKYKNGECLLATDRGVTLAFGECEIALSLTVRRLDYDISKIAFASSSVVYDGLFHTISPSGTVIGEDGIPLKISVMGGGTNTGKYRVVLSFESESRNYNTPAPIERELQISPRPVSLEYSGLEFVYDGSVRVPVAFFENVFAQRVEVALSGGAADAGDYVAYALFSDGNYVIENPSVSFTVKRAALSLSDFKWSASSLVFCGEELSVGLVELPPSVSVIGYVDSVARDAGAYRAIATLSYDENNYEPLPEIYLDWRIEPAEYDMSACRFGNAEVVYDGQVHYPHLYGRMPTGADGSRPEYIFSRGAKDVSDGAVTVCIDFRSVSPNYKAPESVYATVQVLPKSVEVVWGELEFAYDGGAHIPTAYCSECAVTVSGYATEAGEYIATATAADPNFKILNSDVAFMVARAVNEWLVLPGITGIYESGKLSPVGTSRFGEVKFAYFKDEALMEEVELPTEPGRYYAIALVADGENYTALVSQVLEFEIVAVAPSELRCEILRELIALRTVSSADVAAEVINNDGSVVSLSAGELRFVYENGDTLRFRDSFLIIEYGGLSIKLPITVRRAEYDMSAVVWENAYHVYDGEKKCAYLCGLPDGVSVLEYVGNEQTRAGSYQLSAVLSYDGENYYPPVVPTGVLVIERCAVRIEPPPSVTYDGCEHEATVPESALYTAETVRAKNSGKYEIKITLTDSENYYLENSEVFFEIKPIELTLRVLSDGETYRIEKGAFLLGERPEIEFYKEDDKVYLRCLDDNYSITVIPLVSAMAANRIWLGVIVFLLVLIVSLSVAIAVRNPTSIRALLGRVSPRKAAVSDTACVEKSILATDLLHADALISDKMAATLVSKENRGIKTRGSKRYSIKLESISAAFRAGDTVDVNAMKEKGILPEDAMEVKVVGGGVADKALTVIADGFDLGAVKMIAITGGRAIKSRTRRKR